MPAPGANALTQHRTRTQTAAADLFNRNTAQTELMYTLFCFVRCMERNDDFIYF